MKRWIAILLAFFVVRLVVAAVLPLYEDEAYYWQWAIRPAAGYFDHPPAIAWLIAAGLPIFGDSFLGVRLFSVVAGLGAGIALAVTSGRLAGEGGAWRGALIILALPMGAAGLLMATPDAPLFLTLAVAILAVDRALASPPGSRQDTLGWILAGLALGGAFTSKYTAVLFPFGVTVAFLLHPELRKRFATPGPWLASAIALALFTPVVVWNAQHDWASFAFQLGHGLNPEASRPLAQEAELLGGQIGLVSPILFFLLAWATWRALRDRSDPRRFTLAVTATVIFGFFMVTALRSGTEGNWPAPAYLPALVLLASQPLGASGRKWLRWGLGLGFSLVFLMNVQALIPVLPIPARNDPLAEAWGWNELAAFVENDIQTMDAGACPGNTWVAGNNYQDPSVMAFYLPGREPTFDLQLLRRPSQYQFWPGFTDLAEPGDCLVVVFRSGRISGAVAEHLAEGFQDRTEPTTFELRRNLTGAPWEERHIVKYYGWTGSMEAFRMDDERGGE